MIEDLSYKQFSACSGKTKHKTVENAKIEIKRSNKRNVYGAGSGKLIVYKCEFCGFYHIGHNRSKNKNG